MDETIEISSPNGSQFDSPASLSPKPTGPSSSKLTLVLPSLKSIQLQKGAKKSKRKSHFGYPSVSAVHDGEIRKIPRPTKLKPLKEVLTKLISQIKKKDDYAFFLSPVDVHKVAGYSDVVKRPMDFGTITAKVNRGRYRSLEEFASDVRLVTTNAKMFNPLGTLYHTEAERIEAWSLDHITKAATTVIQYETDWNIEIEQDDDDGPLVNIDDDDYIPNSKAGTPMDIDEGGRDRSPSVASQVRAGMSRRTTRIPPKKPVNSNTVTESIDADGRLPGSRDGLGAFPPGSHWAQTMLALKLKGKRYKTKKERMRIERDGPPYCADGSLNYFEMEDPFSVLSMFVPDSLTRPYLTPLYPPSSFRVAKTPNQPEFQHFLLPPKDSTQGQSRSQSQAPQAQTSQPYPSATLLSSSTTNLSNLQPSVKNIKRHWIVVRNLPRNVKIKDDDDSSADNVPSWAVPREAHTLDFGSLAILAGELADEIKRRCEDGVVIDQGGESSASATIEAEKENEKILNMIRDSLDYERSDGSVLPSTLNGTDMSMNNGIGDYWTAHQASAAEDYIRGVVYGGVNGLAYVRSLAEFACYEPLQKYPAVNHQWGESSLSLGMPLAQWIEQHVVDPLTEGRHALLRDTAYHLSMTFATPSQRSPPTISLLKQIALSLKEYPAAAVALSILRRIQSHKIDMSALIRDPEELFLSEEEWAGKVYKADKEKERIKRANDEKMDVDADNSNHSVGHGSPEATVPFELEEPELLNHVLDYTAEAIARLNRKLRERGTIGEGVKVEGDIKEGLTDEPTIATMAVDSEDHSNTSGSPSEDPNLRNLRLNLLALAKRAPLDTIARLPRDLVPAHIRHYIPTLGS